MLKLVPHLTFAGQCEQAFRLYATCFGGELAFLMHYRDSPGPYPAELADLVYHATLRIDGQTVTGVDVTKELYREPAGFALQINLDDPARAHSIYEALREQGQVQFALQPTAWAERYAAVTDRFGVAWEINCGRFA